MNYREATLLAETSITADKVEIIDLDFHDIVSRLDIMYRFAASKHGMDSYGYADISKVEIVDGSDVLYSLDGGELQALNIYNRKCPTMSHGQHWESNSEFETFGIDFGRTLWDRDFAFDPSKFVNPQLKVTVDFATTDTGATPTYLKVKAHMFDERRVTPRGFLMAKEHYSYSIGTDGTYEYVELPQDYPIRKMLIKAYASGYEPWYQIEGIRLDLNNEAKIPFDVNVEEYHRSRKGVDPMVQELFGAQVSDSATTYYVTPTDYYTNVTFMGHTVEPVYHSAIARGGKLQLIGASANAGRGLVTGWLPNHCIQFPFGLEDEPTDWFDPTRVDKARLRLEAGSGGTGTGAIILEQLRTY